MALVVLLLTVLLMSVATRGREQVEAESFVSVVGAALAEEIREVVHEERKGRDETHRHFQEIPQQAVPTRDDNWFVLLEVVPRGPSYVPPGIVQPSALIGCYNLPP